MKIAATGLSGLVGSRVEELLKDKYEFVSIGLSAGIDITNKDSIFQGVASSDADVVLNLAAKADVDGSEEDKALGDAGPAWKLNVIGAENVALACAHFGKRLIHISTDFVFDGEKNGYTEEDVPNPLNWYGKTKFEGERVIQKINGNFIIARIAYPYRTSYKKKDFFRTILSKLEAGTHISAVTDHVMTPTFIDDFAGVLSILLERGEKGIYHVVGDSPISPYEATLLICDKFGFDKKLVSKTTRAQYFADRAVRPFGLFLKNDKIEELGAKMRTFAEGLDEIMRQRGI